MYMAEHLRKSYRFLSGLPYNVRKELKQIIARTPFVMHKETFRVGRIFINDAISLDFRAQKFPSIFPN